MRCARSAIINASLFGLAMLVFPVMFAPSVRLEFLILFLTAMVGGLLAYLYQRCSRTQLSLRGCTLLGAAVGSTAAIVYFASGAMLFAVVTNRHIGFDIGGLEHLLLGTLTFAVASGAGGLLVGLVGKLRAGSKKFY